MSACPINHRNDLTRSRCHNPTCRQQAGRAAQRDAPAPYLSTPRRTLTLSDAKGAPLVIDLERPVIVGAQLSPESMIALPEGARLERCILYPGAYDLNNVTLSQCRVAPDGSLTLRGNSMLATSTVESPVTLMDETISNGNSYTKPPILMHSVSSSADTFRTGYISSENFVGVIDHQNTVGPWQETGTQPGEVKSAAKSVLGAGLSALMYSFGSRGRRGRARRRRR